MNSRRRKGILEAFENLEHLFEQEKKYLDSREDQFGMSESWQNSNKILEDAKSNLADLECSLNDWGIR